METLSQMRKRFGARLRLARRAQGFETARELAAFVQVEEGSLSNYERGKRRPPNDVMLRICTALKITSDYLYFGDTGGLLVDTERRIADQARIDGETLPPPSIRRDDPFLRTP